MLPPAIRNRPMNTRAPPECSKNPERPGWAMTQSTTSHGPLETQGLAPP